ncbi:MAG TPA: TonB family protein [Nitrospira sp.]|nr:TonB family protein [Nitrospira sp.]
MTSTDQNRFLLPAWGFSLLLHGLAVLLAVIFAAQVKPVLKEEVFKWDVALVDAVRTESLPEPAQPIAPEVQTHSKPVVPRPSTSTRETALNRVAPHQSVEMVHSRPQPAKPIEQKADLIAPPQFEPVEQMAEVRPQAHEPIEQQAVEVPKSDPQPVLEAEKPEPAPHVEPVIAQRQPLAPIPPAETKEDRVAQPPVSETSTVEPVREANIQNPAQPATSAEPTTPSPPKASLPEASTQVAKTAPGPDTKIDHRWVGESLWRRVGELKRYPTSARLNGQEGKVILKAVIRADGHLAEVSVQKSSGHHILDTAAMEAVRLACPLHMKHAISKSEIVVSLPIVYSLAN